MSKTEFEEHSLGCSPRLPPISLPKVSPSSSDSDSKSEDHRKDGSADEAMPSLDSVSQKYCCFVLFSVLFFFFKSVWKEKQKKKIKNKEVEI